MVLFFFFSSRRRHTRFDCDWSSDVCSSDLEAVQQVAQVLALAIVGDGEGASKLVEIHVVGAASEAAAREVGRAIARSTLVKTATYGADPNWGQIGRASCRERV